MKEICPLVRTRDFARSNRWLLSRRSAWSSVALAHSSQVAFLPFLLKVHASYGSRELAARMLSFMEQKPAASGVPAPLSTAPR